MGEKDADGGESTRMQNCRRDVAERGRSSVDWNRATVSAGSSMILKKAQQQRAKDLILSQEETGDGRRLGGAKGNPGTIRRELTMTRLSWVEGEKSKGRKILLGKRHAQRKGGLAKT